MLLPKVTTLQHSELSVTGVTAVSLRHAALLYVNIAAPRHSSHASTLPASHSRGGGCLYSETQSFAQFKHKQVGGLWYLLSTTLDAYIYKESPRGAASGLSRCNFFRLQTSLLSLFLVQMG